MAVPSEAYREAKAFFHALSKVNTEISQYVFESLYKSAHTVRGSDVWSDDIAYAVDFITSDAWVIANPTIGHKYLLHDLTEIPGSNGQGWYLDDGGVFINKWIAPTDIPHLTTKAPSYGFQARLYQDDGVTVVPPANGVWNIDYYAGIVMFQAGETPTDRGYGIPKITLYNYVGATGSGGGGGSINLYDETTDLGIVSNIRAVGTGISASVSGSNGYLFVPPATFPPDYNTGTCAIPDITTINRHIASPTSPTVPFDIGAWVGGTSHETHENTVNINYSTPEVCAIDDLTTTFEVLIYGADDVTPIANFTTPILTGDNIYTGGGITVTITNWATEYLRYQADINIQIDIGALLPNGGRYSIEIIHHNAGTDYTKVQGPMFMDQESAVAVLSGVGIVENLPVTKILSGITHYTIGSTFDANIADIDNINNSSYPYHFLRLEGDDYALPAIPRNSSGMTGWTNVWDNINSSFDEPNWAITTIGVSTISTTGTIIARTEDWISGSWVSSPVNAILVDTLVDGSSGILEDFTTENSRITIGLGIWDNTQDLTIYDSGNGLQISGGRLVYPTTDFTIYNPNPVGQFDYSGQVGDKVFNSHFEHSGVSHSNGIFELNDYNITETDILSGDIVLEISLDGISWFNCGNSYGGGPLVNGDGCRINSGTNNLGLNNRIQFTLGAGGTTGLSTGIGWGIYYRITFTDTDTSNYIGELQITDWV